MKLIFLALLFVSSFSFANTDSELMNPVKPPPYEPPPNRPPPPYEPPPNRPPPPAPSYFDWGVGQNGYGYCYEWLRPGTPLNGGRPQPNYLCERYRPSYYDWGRAQNGGIYCYQYTPYHVPMNEGRPQPDYLCR